MPYAPGVTNQAGALLAQGLSQAGAAIGSGIQQGYQNDQASKARELIAKEKQERDHLEYKKYLGIANALDPDNKKRHETMGVGDLAQIAARAAQELTGRMEEARLKQIQGLADDKEREREQRERFNQLYPEAKAIGMSDQEAFIAAATRSGTLNPNTAASWLQQPGIFGKEDLGKAQPVDGLPGTYFLPTTQNGGQILSGGGQPGVMPSPISSSDRDYFRKDIARMREELTAGGLPPALKQDYLERIQRLEALLPENQGRSAPADPPAQGSGRRFRFDPQQGLIPQ